MADSPDPAASPDIEDETSERFQRSLTSTGDSGLAAVLQQFVNQENKFMKDQTQIFETFIEKQSEIIEKISAKMEEQTNMLEKISEGTDVLKKQAEKGT